MSQDSTNEEERNNLESQIIVFEEELDPDFEPTQQGTLTFIS